MSIEVGREYIIGWNAAKMAGDTGVAYSGVRVEAAGYDWVVFRDSLGRAHSATFDSKQEKEDFLKEFK